MAGMAHKQAQEISGTPMTPRCYRNSSFNPKEGCEGSSIRTPAKASTQNLIKPQRLKVYRERATFYQRKR